MGMITIGPVAVPVMVLLLAAALSAAHLVSRRRSGIHRARVDSTLQYILFAGILAARVSFVVAYWETYRAAPLSVVDIRDGGFHPWSGLIAGAAVALVAAGRERLLLRPLMLSLAAGATTSAAAAALAWVLLDSSADHGLPAGTFTRLDGTPMQFGTFAGRPVVVNLWASWCPPVSSGDAGACTSSGRRIQMSCSCSRTRARARRLHVSISARSASTYGTSFSTHGWTSGVSYAPAALPTTVFFDREGKRAGVRFGELSAGSLVQQLAPLKQSR